MTSIDIPRDDIGTHDLKLKNAGSASVKPTSAVLPYPAIGDENQIRDIIREQLGHKQQRRHEERRKGERRHHREPVLLDTRSHRDRRHQEDRRSDDGHVEGKHAEGAKIKGIDAYV